MSILSVVIHTSEFCIRTHFTSFQRMHTAHGNGMNGAYACGLFPGNVAAAWHGGAWLAMSPPHLFLELLVIIGSVFGVNGPEILLRQQMTMSSPSPHTNS